MTVKVILWGSKELLKAISKDFGIGNSFYEKNEGTLIEYRWIADKDQESIKRLLNKQGNKYFVVIEKLTLEKLTLLMADKQKHEACYFFINEDQTGGYDHKKVGWKYWCFLPFFHPALFSKLTVELIHYKEESILSRALKGGTILVGETAQISGAGALMSELFKGWQFVEKRKHVQLDLYSDAPLALEMLSEVEDAACQYIDEKSYFQLLHHEKAYEPSRLYYRIAAF